MVTTVGTVSRTVPVRVNDNRVPSYSIAPVSAVVFRTPEAIFNGAVEADAVPAGRCRRAVGDAVPMPRLFVTPIESAVTAPRKDEVPVMVRFPDASVTTMGTHPVFAPLVVL